MAVGLPFLHCSNSHAQGCRDGVAGVTAGKGVKLTLQRRGERSDALELAIGVKPIASACQDFMAVCLMPHVPHNAVVGRLIDVVECHGEINGPHAGRKVPGVNRQFVYNLSP